MYNKIVLLAFEATLFLTSCSRFDDSSLINFDFKLISDARSVDMTNRVVPEDLSFARMNYFLDSLMISFPDGSSSFVVSVSDVRTDSLIGSFIPKGRSEKEPMDVFPFMDIVEEGDSSKALIFSYRDNRFFMWDVSGSLATGSTLYDWMMPLDLESGSFLPAVSFYYLPGEKIILHNTHQTISDWMEEPATYEVYSAVTGKREKVFSPFALYKGEETMGEDGLFGSKVYLSLEDCIKPSRDKLAFGMKFIPYFGVLDVETGEVTGIRLDKYPGLNPNRIYFHFIDLDCDDEYIYALYCGGGNESLNYPESSYIFIFDWDCKLVGKVRVVGAHRICLNGETLHILNCMAGKAYRIDLDEIKSSL